MRRILDLFVAGTPSYSDEQIALFGDVIGRLMKNADRALLAELSTRLAPLDNGPVDVLGALARHTDIAVCGPILEHAKALPDEALVAIADNDRVDAKRLAKIAARAVLSEAVTDVLIKRGDRAMQRKVIDNPTARISEEGFARLVSGVNGDKELAAAMATRQDVPAELRMWLAKVLE